ncbi:MAG: signal recognition particle-docking protein FtsY [Bacilli bacterium]|jgi:fused signal recognition particle receptor
MGLFKFLKEKLSKKKNDNTEQQSLDKYNKGLEKSRINFSNKLDGLAKKYKEVNEDYFNDLEEILIEADCGIEFTLQIISEILETSKEQKITNPKDINELLVDKMFYDYLKDGEDIHNEIEFNHKPEVLLMVGVNGVGKTTTIAKIAYRYQKVGKRILLVAADTFRAGATEQLLVWGKRMNLAVVTGKENEDPASVAYAGLSKGIKENYDLVIIDTAGRLQNKQFLMDELAKIKRVISKEIDYDFECFLVIDATTGQNGVVQAKAFKEIINITGIVITKMDGTSKGGIILAIRNSLHIPVRFIGLGERMDDLEEFDLDKYLYGLCGGLIENE